MKRSKTPAYVSVDVETTGLVPGTDHLYEIALLAFDEQGKELGRFESLCRPCLDKLPKRLRPAEAAPSFEEIAGSVIDWMKLAPVVGHNVSFDLMMIAAELERFGAALPEVEFIDTLGLVVAVGIDSPNNQLSTLCHVLGIEEGAFHTATADALAASQLLTKMRASMSPTKKLAALPEPQVFHGGATSWPDLPGRAAPLVRGVSVFPAPSRAIDRGLYTDDTPISSSVGVTFTINTAPPPAIQQEMDEKLIEIARQAVAQIPPDAEVPDEIAEVVAQIMSDDFATALKGSKVLADHASDPDGEIEASEDDFKKGRFVGAEGIARLSHIVEVFTRSGNVQLADATLGLARLKRYELSCDADEVEASYRVAFDVALAEDREFNEIYGDDDHEDDHEDEDEDEDDQDDDEEQDEDEFETATPVLDEWLEYLQALGDRDRVTSFLKEFSDPTWGFST